jgi:hypothetical protein
MGQAVIVVIVAITCISVIWFGAGANEAWSEILAKAGSTLGILLIFPIIYFWNLFRLGTLARKKAHLLQIIGLSGVIIFAVVALVGVVSQRQSLAMAPTEANDASSPSEVTLSVPKLGTQIAKEDFQRAINNLSLLVKQVDEIVKISAPIAGNRPLVREDLNGASEPLLKLQHAREIYRAAHEQLIGGGEGEFFKKFSLSQKQALLSILPRGSQALFDKYNVDLLKITVALMLVQDAERHKEDGAQYQRAISNAEFLANDFRLPISELHDWVNVMNQRMDQMSNSM